MTHRDAVLQELDAITREMREADDAQVDELEALLARRETVLGEIAAIDPRVLGRDSLASLKNALRAGDIARKNLVRARQRIFADCQALRQMRSALYNPEGSMRTTISVKL